MLASAVLLAAVFLGTRTVQAEDFDRLAQRQPAPGVQPPEPPRVPGTQPPARGPGEALPPLPRPAPPADEPALDDFQFGEFLAADTGTSLASLPDMFGDSFFRGGQLTLVNMPTIGSLTTLATDVPLAAATRRVLIAEHNKALPVDRVYFNYNHFHNALATTVAGTPGPLNASDRSSVNQYTFGMEKTFGGGLWSCELRLPLAGDYDFFVESVDDSALVSGGDVGNLAVILKRQLYCDPCRVISAGIGIDLPTGDDALFATTTPISTTNFRLDNEAVYLLPYVAATGAPDERRFWHTFVQLDVPVGPNGYRFETSGAIPPSAISGDFTDQTLLHVDVGGGYWLYRPGCCGDGLLTGLAALVELHYTTTLDSTDVEAVTVGTFPTFGSFDLRSAANRSDVLNLTTGVHLGLGGYGTLRVAGAFPLRDGDNRWFDSEVLVQFVRRF